MNFNWNNYKTDKNMSGYGYDHAYDYILSSNRLEIKKVLEIGTRIGSVELWLNYFPKCKLYGIDLIDPNFISDRFIFEKINQGDDSGLKSFIEKHGCNYDVIIDDGPHTTPEQLISFNILFDTIKSGGVYIIEDLHATEPYDENYLSNRKNCDYSILDILREFKNLKYKENIYLYNLEQIKTQIKDIVIMKGQNNRWPNHVKECSDIAFIFKK